MNSCRHHWMLDAPSPALTEHGVCRSCGEERFWRKWQESYLGVFSHEATLAYGRRGAESRWGKRLAEEGETDA